MLDYKQEKQDAETFITTVVKKLSTAGKQRAADIALGLLLAEDTEPKQPDKPKYPQGGIPAQCG